MSDAPATALPEHRDLDDRLAEWRRACLVRQGRHAEATEAMTRAETLWMQALERLERAERG